MADNQQRGRRSRRANSDTVHLHALIAAALGLGSACGPSVGSSNESDSGENGSTARALLAEVGPGAHRATPEVLRWQS